MPCRALARAVLVVPLVAALAWAGLSPEQERALDGATYVYVQSERKAGDWSKPAEIWFFTDAGKVVVGTRPGSWRVRRIKAGRTKARIAIGSPGGPTLDATGAVVKDAALEQRLMDAFARKYPEGWGRHAESFREGFKTGERVLVVYSPR